MTSGSWVLPDELRQLAESGESQLVQEVLVIFQSDTAQRLAALRAALAANRRAEVKNQAHAMKGSAGQVGAVALAAICQKIESQAFTAPPADLDDLVRQFDQSFTAVCCEMKA